MPHAPARHPTRRKGRARLAAGPWAMGSADVRASGYVIFLCRASRRAPRSDVPPATPHSYAKPARTRPSPWSGDRVGGHPLLDSTMSIPGTCGCLRHWTHVLVAARASGRASRAALRACRPARAPAASTTCGNGRRPAAPRALEIARRGLRHGERAARGHALAGHAAHAQVVRVFAAVEVLDQRRSGDDALARQQQAVLVGGDEQASRRRLARVHRPPRVAPSTAAQAATSAASARADASLDQRRTAESRGLRDHGSGIVAQPLLEQPAVNAAEVGCGAEVAVLVQPPQSRGTRRPSSPRACVPISIPSPAAPWSVPSEPFSSPRRPNSDQTCTSTRSARPRASRSRWKASRPSAVAFRFSARSAGWLSCVS